MSAKKQMKKSRPKRKAKPKRVTKTRTQKMWHPANYLLESNAKLGLPEHEEDTRAYASPV